MGILHGERVRHRLEKLDIVEIISERHALVGCDAEFVLKHTHGTPFAHPRIHQVYPIGTREHDLKPVGAGLEQG